MTMLTVDQAAKQLNVSPRLVRRLIARGELRAVRISRLIRVPEDALARVGRPVTTAADRVRS